MSDTPTPNPTTATDLLTPGAVIETIGAERHVPRLDELAEAMLRQFGGMAEFAKVYHQEFTKVAKTPMVRARMLEGLMRLLVQASESAPKNLSALSEQDLKRLLLEELAGELRRLQEPGRGPQ